MRRIAAVMILIMVIWAVPIQAQDECDIADIASELATTAATVETIEDLLLYQAAVQTYVTNCTATDEDSPGLRRSNPVPLGEWFTFSTGQFRILEMTPIDVVPEGSFYTLPEQHHLIAVQVEYSCTVADENTTCNGLDFAGLSVVGSDASVIPVESRITANTIFGKQVFSGGVISGAIYYTLPDGVEATALQYPNRFGDFEPIFFSTVEAE